MSLTQYRKKRNFRVTPEPSGQTRPPTKGAGEFVVQKHAASRLHYDFRLEWDGVLKSWAVPKGPSLDPGVKSLAVEVEDHPLAYGSFEGIIPQGAYGGGTVMLWDRGTWKPDGDPRRGFRQGKLNFHLFGTKLHGGWSLVRMRKDDTGEKHNWLLIKRSDAEARSGEAFALLEKHDKSVVSHRDLEEIAQAEDKASNNRRKNNRSSHSAKKRTSPGNKGKSAKALPRLTKTEEVAKLPGVRRAPLPRTFRPQLATLVAEAPPGQGWLHEVKLDGYRILAFVRKGRVRLMSRNGGDWSKRFADVGRAVQSLNVTNALFDGEVVCLNPEGISDFQQLQNWLKDGGKTKLFYYVFDVPHFDGFDLSAVPLEKRKELLSRLVLSHNPRNNGVLRYSDHLRNDGAAVVKQACRFGLEGIISKDAESAYVQGRTRSWLKAKCLKRQEFVIGGYTRPSGTRKGFGALLLGHYEGDDLIYSGRVGTGFTEASLRHIFSELKRRRVDSPVFLNPPTGAQRRGVTWVRPELVAEVEFTQWTQDGLLRHPSFCGLREDKPASEVIREKPQIVRKKKRSATRARQRNKP